MPNRIRTVVATVLPPIEVAHAHSGSDSYVFVVVDDHDVHGTVQHPLGRLAGAIGAPMPEEADAEGFVADHADTIVALVGDHVTIAGADGPWSPSFGPPRVLAHGHGTYVIVPFTIPVVVGDPTAFTITSTGPGAADHDHHHHGTLVIAKTFDGVGRFRTARSKRFEPDPDTGTAEVVLDAGSPVRSVVGAARGVGRGLRRRLPGA